MIRRPPRSTLFPTRRSSDLVALRGNTVMKGYLRNPAANEAAFAGGWFHTGDLGVLHPDGYIEVKDRAKDIVISGGDRKSTRLNSSHANISYAVFCLKKKKKR